MPPLPPTWDGFHPLFVHFPVALFVVAPLLVLLAAVTGKKAIMFCALLLLGVGVVTSFLATNTGEAAYDIMEPDEDLDPEGAAYDLAEEHMESSEFARNVFAGVTGVYAVLFVVGLVKPKTLHLKPRLITHAVVLLVLAWGNMLLANAAHMGGELVHRYGVRAALAPLEEATEEEAASDEATSGSGSETTTE